MIITSPRNIRGRSSGYALVTVLTIIVLVVGISVAFLLKATTERSAASSYAASMKARQFAETAVSVVQAQINDAATQGSQVAWASQPGMIRTFGTDGNLLDAYKLYSASDMITDQVSLTSDLPPANWRNHPSMWVDLNAPVSVNNVRHFPILDPTVMEPIGSIDGLNDNAPGATRGFALNSPPGETANQPAPMPVRWLYVLQDGALVAPTGSDATPTIPDATPSNPVVGRVAFWTDDESSKVNINTAGAGTYWDAPRAATNTERDHARFQPSRGEFQRYPGHPATVSLSAILPGLNLNQYLQLAPRYRFGGSQGGTTIGPNEINLANPDRLYTSLDEMMFDDPQHGADARPPGALFQSSIETGKRILQSRRFFLTAKSRAPETNLFNLPRIAMWPVFRLTPSGLPDLSRTTAFDRLIAFCASTEAPGGGTRPYFFQREIAASGTNDLASIGRNMDLYNYLGQLTSRSVPGFGGNIAAKYPTDRNQILTQIFDYIRNTNLLDNLVTPGPPFTIQSAATSLSAGHGQVTPIQHPNGTMGFGRIFTLSELGILFICNAMADSVPGTEIDESESNNPEINNTLTEALSPNERRIEAIILPELFNVMQGWIPTRPNLRVRITGLETLAVNGVNLGFPADGTAEYNGNLLGSFHGVATGGNAGYRFSIVNKRALARPPVPRDSAFDNRPGHYNGYPFISRPITISAPVGGTMEFSGGRVKVEIYSGGATPGTVNSSELVQTIEIDLPSGTFPVPTLVPTGTSAAGSVAQGETTTREWWSFARDGIDGTGPLRGRLAFGSFGTRIGNRQFGAFVRNEYDVLRTVVPSHGDFRLVAARREILADEEIFMKHPRYDELSFNVASSLSNPKTPSDEAGNDLTGKYVQSISYHGTNAPDIPSNATQTPDLSGDFDTGLAQDMDGPYVNKPDEGNTFGLGSGSANLPYFSNTQQAESGYIYFSPNRQVPSPGMLGSLPTGVRSGRAWQTLLFRPQQDHPNHPSNHSGSGAIPDHVIMDLFWMPVVEPYAISDRFSTAGKINMNFQILPFTYIDRTAPMRAALQSERMMAIGNDQAAMSSGSYKNNSSRDYRFELNLDEIIGQLKTHFDAGEIYRSATEICDIHMVPVGQTAAGMVNFWNSHRLTGDNMRERIYTTIYQKLTTRSNTYTVHFRAQALRKSSASDPGTWDETRDSVVGEYRGHTMIERFIDPANTGIPDYAASGIDLNTTQTLDSFYRWRVVENKQFAP